MTTSERKVTRFRVLRAAATPLLAVGLVIGAWVAVGAGSLLADTVSRPAEGHFAGMGAFAVGLVAVAGVATAVNCVVGLWLFWRRWKPPAAA